MSPRTTDIRRALSDVYASGQPSPDQLATLAAEGVRTVFNLRAPIQQVEFDEALEAKKLGLRYISIPITGPQDVSTENCFPFQPGARRRAT